MSATTTLELMDNACVNVAVEQAVRAIPPAWPLASSVAVNPFLGQTCETLAAVGARLQRVAGAPVTMPRSWYDARISEGRITDGDLSAALASTTSPLRPQDLAALKSAARIATPAVRAAPTIADLSADASGIDWPGLLAERFSCWAAGYFDEGQALWAAPRGRNAYSAWRAVATHDLTPEIVGLGGFASYVSEAPESANEAMLRAVQRLALPVAALETYFHALLMTLGGWAQYARYHLWHAELDGRTDTILRDFLAIRLVWEAALFERYADQIDAQWTSLCALHAAAVAPTADHVVDAILQEASERAAQRELAALLDSQGRAPSEKRPDLQAAFCIDVRSEVFRRALESVHPDIQTLGFAGFFGLATSHRRFASDVDEHRLPVLLTPSLHTRSGGADNALADQSARLAARAKRAWGRFKLAAVSSFAFVEATGPVYAGKLFSDAIGLRAAPAPNEPAPQLNPDIDLATKTKAAASILRAMSIATNFARLVLVVGHGANVVNNPHASALQCGACGGYSGEVNARMLAALLNDTDVRLGLADQGITLPADTLFVGALHDTTTDAMTLYDVDCRAGSATHATDLIAARSWLAAAAKIARGERAVLLPRSAGEGSLMARSRDWAELRPEWGLAGCNAFIAAPRWRTAGKSFAGRAFLHEYDSRIDQRFEVLEAILTAPVVVASWISLQYYGSTVAPKVFGGGNKLLHNVSGGVGVVEGNGGLLHAGLPWQSVHDGEHYAHEPLRLSVCIEAPHEAISEILQRHADVRALFDNRWLHLFALDASGRMAWRYTGDLQWISEQVSPQ